MRALRGVAVCSALCAVVLLPRAVAAQSSSTPAYDIDGYCEQVSQAIGGSYQIKAQCMHDEREARVEIAGRAIERRIARYCDEVARAIGGSYQIYAQCVKDEEAARDGA